MVGLPLWAFKKIGRWVREGEDVEDCAANPARRQGSMPEGPRRAVRVISAARSRSDESPARANRAGGPHHFRFANALPLSFDPYFFRRSY